MKHPLILIGSVLISFAAGAIGSLATISNIPTWYATLNKPPLLPPNSVFGPVWTVLYITMGVALYLIIIAPQKNKKEIAYRLFALQLLLNTLWSIVFFGLHMTWAGAAIILSLLATLVFVYRAFYMFSKPAAYLFIPYILWVSFATYLNIGVALLND